MDLFIYLFNLQYCTTGAAIPFSCAAYKVPVFQDYICSTVLKEYLRESSAAESKEKPGV
jgi:hypothetical protein